MPVPLISVQQVANSPAKIAPLIYVQTVRRLYRARLSTRVMLVLLSIAVVIQTVKENLRVTHDPNANFCNEKIISRSAPAVVRLARQLVEIELQPSLVLNGALLLRRAE